MGHPVYSVSVRGDAPYFYEEANFFMICSKIAKEQSLIVNATTKKDVDDSYSCFVTIDFSRLGEGNGLWSDNGRNTNAVNWRCVELSFKNCL
jgi:hypothetical protein